jgi:class 3 adenylate cyclase/tetratricopeptide (TPR) repeat protein
VSAIRSWLESLNLGEYAEAFEANKIDADVLPHLTERDLSDLGVPVGPRRKILVAIRELSSKAVGERPPPAAAVAPSRAAERRQITVMFCDLVGSTALSETLDAEDLRGVMHAYQQAAGAVIERYAGHIAQYLGDGLMTYFGWPAAHEDDAQRAVMAGLDIVEAVKGLQVGVPLHVRVGVASGPVVVGETGAGDASLPRFAVGETPNLAARIQGLADRDQVVIAASTRRLIGAGFDLEDLGVQTLKGFAEPMRAWRVVGVATTEGRFEAAHGGGLTPFVGREPELLALQERWQKAVDGEGQVVLLCGEPGIGKSRLAQVMREQVAGRPHVQLHYQCSPYHTSSALHPVAEQIRRVAGFGREDDTQTQIDKLEAVLNTALDDPTAATPLLAALLSLDVGERYPRANLSPQAQKDATLKAVIDFFRGLASRQPVLILFEDVHWIDPTTQELVDLLLPAMARWRILALITYRPEYQPPWTDLPHVTALPLARLPHAQAQLLTEKVTGGKRLPAEVLDQIVVKTDGVPLFVEELTKTVLESGLVVEAAESYRLVGALPELAIPSTLHDSLMARLDRAAPMREVAQIGACIGRQFSRELLAAVSPLEGRALDNALRQLQDAELVFRTGQGLAASYTFKHALVQDAAYKSLLRATRQTIHGRIAETLLREFTDIVASAPELLARHYTEAGVYDRAARYWRVAAERASARFANAEAIAHARNGLAAAAHMSVSAERVEVELALRMALAGSLRMTDRYEQALDELQRAEALATEHQRLLDLSRIHTLRGNIYFPLGQVERCFAEHQSAWEFARRAGSTEDEARALGGLGDAYYVGGRFRTARDQFDRCVTLCRAHALRAIEIAYLPMRATADMYCMEFASALDDCEAVNHLVASAGQARGELLTRNVSSWIFLERHEFAQAERDARRGLELSDLLGSRRFVPLFNDIIARIRLHTGDRTGARELLKSSWEISRETGVTFIGPFVLGAMALASADGDRRTALQEGRALLDRGCVSHNYFWFYRDAIEVSLEETDWDAAETYALALESYFRAEPAGWPDFIVARGRVLAEFGRHGACEAVVAQLERLCEEATRLGMQAELSRLEQALRRPS